MIVILLYKIRKVTKVKKINGFTLTEVLIAITIIGIVSALVIPSVLRNYNDKKYNTARLKALKTFGEAGKLASINGEINGQENARLFVENVLSKYLKITKICDTAEECNFPTTFKSSDNTTVLTSNELNSWNKIGSNATTNNSPTKNQPRTSPDGAGRRARTHLRTSAR